MRPFTGKLLFLGEEEVGRGRHCGEKMLKKLAGKLDNQLAVQKPQLEAVIEP